MSWKSALRNRSLVASVAILVVVAAIWGTVMAASAQPRSLDDQVNDVASQLQCLPCQGESVADSPSTWAMQVRGVIREKLRAGQSEQQVIAYFVSVYGDRIRQTPPMSGFTLLIWLGPVIMLLAGVFVVTNVARQWRAMAAATETDDPELDGMSDDELERYRALLSADDDIDTDDAPPRSLPRSGARTEVR